MCIGIIAIIPALLLSAVLGSVQHGECESEWKQVLERAHILVQYSSPSPFTEQYSKLLRSFLSLSAPYITSGQTDVLLEKYGRLVRGRENEISQLVERFSKKVSSKSYLGLNEKTISDHSPEFTFQYNTSGDKCIAKATHQPSVTFTQQQQPLGLDYLVSPRTLYDLHYLLSEMDTCHAAALIAKVILTEIQLKIENRTSYLTKFHSFLSHSIEILLSTTSKDHEAALQEGERRELEAMEKALSKLRKRWSLNKHWLIIAIFVAIVLILIVISKMFGWSKEGDGDSLGDDAEGGSSHRHRHHRHHKSRRMKPRKSAIIV